jgi:post-segregation antitoxin (ccd killing protein)
MEIWLISQDRIRKLEMAQATITLSGEGVQDIQTLNVQIAVEATIHVDAKTARKRATAWLASEVGNMLMAGTPQLVIAAQTVWRLPVLLTSSLSGIVGEVGTVDVDAATGEPAVNDELKNRILANVQQLISPSLSPAG